jgi:hypothetical protein
MWYSRTNPGITKRWIGNHIGNWTPTDAALRDAVCES